MFFHPLEAQTTLERAIKALLTARNDDARSRRDAAIMWPHIETVHTIADRQGAQAMNDLIAATTAPDEPRCSLTRFTEAVRQWHSHASSNGLRDASPRPLLHDRPAEALIARSDDHSARHLRARSERGPQQRNPVILAVPLNTNNSHRRRLTLSSWTTNTLSRLQQTTWTMNSPRTSRP